MSTRIRFRRDTAANWTSNNPILTTGELGYESNTGKFKIGDSTTAWTSLGYSITSELSEGNLNDLKDVTITSASSGQFLKWNGTAWVNDAVPVINNIDDITGVTITAAADKDFLMYNGTAWVDSPITLGTDTTGSYVTSLVAGTGVTLANNSGEGATPTITVDTSAIQAKVANVTDTEIGYLDGVTSAIQTQMDLKAALASPTLTGVPLAPTASAGNNSTQIATTAYADAAVAAIVDSAPATLNTLNELADALGDDANFAATTATSIGLKAPLASPALTGTPTAPTAAAATNTTQIATTAFVIDAVTSATAANTVELGVDTTGSYVASLVAGTGVTLANNSGEGATPTVTVDTTVIAALASPTFTGTPTLPTGTIATTQTAADSTTAVATTAFVTTANNLKANLASPTFTGTPTLPTGTIATTQTAADNTTAVATTAFVTTAVAAVSVDFSSDQNILANAVFG